MKWKKTNLSKISKPKQWKNLPGKKLLESGYTVYGANGIIGYYSEYTHENPTIAITCRGATSGNIHITKPKSYINSNAMALDQIDETKYDLKFIYYALLFRGLKDTISGAAQPQITRTNLTRIDLNIPVKLTDQKRIAQVLSNCENLIQKRKESIALLDELLKSTFLEMFGDPAINANNFKLSEVNKIISRPIENGLYLKKEKYINNGIEMVHMSDLFYDVVKRGNLKRVKLSEKEIEKYKIDENDILIARRSLNFEGAAKACLIPKSDEKLVYESSMIRITPDKQIILPIYLFYFLNNERAKRKFVLKRVTKSTISGINQSNLNKIKVIIPPIELQEKFLLIVKKVDSIKQHYQTHLQELENLYASISQKAFKGELDLSEVLLRETKYFSDSPNETPEDFKREMDALLKEKETNEVSKTAPVHFKIALIEHFKYNKGTYQDFITDYISRYKNRNVWVDHEQLKIEVFKLLEGSKPKLIQYFDDNDNTVKLKLTDEAFKA